MFCPQCGTTVPDGDRFCGGCGSAAAPAQSGGYAPVQRPPSPPPPAPVSFAPPAWTAPPAPPPPYYPPQAPPPPPGFGPPLPPQFAAPPAPYAYPPQPAPAYPPQAPMMAASGGPIPPNMHWAVILILSWFTGGLAALIWVFKQAAFVKKIDPGSKAIVLLVISLLAIIGEVALVFTMMGSRSTSDIAAVSGIMMLLNLLLAVVGLITVFGMRKSIVRYYNTTEPIGLRLSGVMTFFFSILYFQYHFSRIAAWKRTGQLR
jgi:hypothetical protein